MYRKIYTLLLLFALILTKSAFSAPAFSISDPGIWGEGVLSYDSMFSPVLSILAQDQSYKFPEQIHRFVGVKSDDTTNEERHYEKKRSSKLDYSSVELMAGVKLWDRILFYGLIGRADVTFNFNYSDSSMPVKTLSVKEEFEPDESLIFGGGISGVIYDKSYKEFIERVKFGFDARFRQISFRTDWIEEGTKFYKTYLNEYQLAFIAGITIDYFNPYFGFRVSNTIGRETYALQDHEISADYNVSTVYDESVDTQKNMGWVYGASFNILDKGSVNLDFRTGDESSYGLSASVKF